MPDGKEVRNEVVLIERPLTIREFQLLGNRTLKDLGSVSANEIHMLTGIGEELLSELIDADPRILNPTTTEPPDIINAREELGDAQYFAVQYAYFHGIRLKEDYGVNSPFEDNTIPRTTNLIKAFGTLLGYAKSIHAYGASKTPITEEDRRKHIETIIYEIEDMAKGYGIHMSLIRRNVINKLIKRYPDKYSDVSALNRNLPAEREQLEKE